MGMPSIKAVFVGSKDEKCSDSRTMVWTFRWFLASWILVWALENILPNFSHTTSQISTPNDSDGNQMGMPSIKAVFVGSKDEKCSDAMTIVWTFSICK
jgi:hypothetical protein